MDKYPLILVLKLPSPTQILKQKLITQKFLLIQAKSNPNLQPENFLTPNLKTVQPLYSAVVHNHLLLIKTQSSNHIETPLKRALSAILLRRPSTNLKV